MAEAFLGCAGQVQLPEGYLKQVFKLVTDYIEYCHLWLYSCFVIVT